MPREQVEEALKAGKRVGLFRDDPKDLMYGYEQKLPLSHTNHFHVYFPTIKWKLRDTGEWLAISTKGRPDAYDNPEVRALASKYGDPEVIFRYDWIPAIPGINVAGDYMKDYAQDPWKWVVNEWNQIKDGSYKYLVPDYVMTRNTVKKNERS